MSQLSLGSCVKMDPSKLDPSPLPSFQQNLYYKNEKMVITTNSYQMQSINVRECQFGYTVVIPVESWMREQLDGLELYTRNNTKIPEELLSSWKPLGNQSSPYKPFWPGSVISVRLSDWCKLEINSEHCGDFMDSISRLMEGSYQFEIVFPYIYFGKHSNNFLCSITARVTKVRYQPLHLCAPVKEKRKRGNKSFQ